MKTGIDHIWEHFNAMSYRTTQHLNKRDKICLDIALQQINYLEGLAFAALMAHKENEDDSIIAARMSQEAADLRSVYYEKLRAK